MSKRIERRKRVLARIAELEPTIDMTTDAARAVMAATAAMCEELDEMARDIREVKQHAEFAEEGVGAIISGMVRTLEDREVSVDTG